MTFIQDLLWEKEHLENPKKRIFQTRQPRSLSRRSRIHPSSRNRGTPSFPVVEECGEGNMTQGGHPSYPVAREIVDNPESDK